MQHGGGPQKGTGPRRTSIIGSDDASQSSGSRLASRSRSGSPIASSPHHPRQLSTISSRISLRHGISIDELKLLSENPPETRFTSLACNPRGSPSGHATPTGLDDSTLSSDEGSLSGSVTAMGPTLMDAETGIHVQRHPDLWFDDGSVICRAENTLFCVHMSQLARHSLVFHDMFMLPQPEATRLESSMLLNDGMSSMKTTTTRRVPVVYLYDSPEDVGNLLTALYDGPAFGNNDEDDFRIVAGILRLSTKYLVDSLRAKALAHLTTAWPSDLKAWDTREDLARDVEGGAKRIKYPHPAAVLSLAREVNAPSLLQAAFYDLSRHSFAQIFEPTEDDYLYQHLPPPPLSPQDMQRLCLGKEAGQHTITSLIQSMGSGHYFRYGQSHPVHVHARKASSGAVCVSAAACRKDFTELVDLATQHYLFDRERGCCDPLYVAEELGQLKSAEFSECKACARALESWAAREREKIWKMVPYWFRLEPLGASGSSSPQPS